MSASLDGPIAKLDRAYEHLESLDPEIATFIATKPYAFERDFDSTTGEHVFRLRIREPMPLRIGTIVGDFATNTRAALDHLVWQLVILNGKEPNSKTAFPVYDTPPTDPHCSKSPIARVRKDHRERILQFQPHVAGKDAEKTAVSLLSRLVNTDKHRVVHPTYGFFTTPERAFFTFHTPGGLQVPAACEQIKIAKGRRGVDGAELARVKLTDPDLTVEISGEFPIDIAFGDRWLRATALEQIYRSIRAFVESFSPEFA